MAKNKNDPWEAWHAAKVLLRIRRDCRMNLILLERMVEEAKRGGDRARANALEDAWDQMATWELAYAQPVPQTHPDEMVIACTGFRTLTWTTARKEHFCIHCGEVAAEPSDSYLRNDQTGIGDTTEAWCKECAWRLFGPDGLLERVEGLGGVHRCGAGCLLEEGSPAAEEAAERADREVMEALEKIDFHGEGKDD